MSFNMHAWLQKTAADKTTAAKKDAPGDTPVETRLRDRKPEGKEPSSLSEAQLKGQRQEGKPVLTEKKLENRRKAPPEQVTEAMLDASESKLVKHRNAEAHAGDINKLEEKRLANDPVEEEKAEPAAKMDSSFVVPKITGKDGVRIAVKLAGRFDETYDVSKFDIGEEMHRKHPDVDSDEEEMFGAENSSGFSFDIGGAPEELDDEDLDAPPEVGDDVDKATQALIDDLTKDIGEEDAGSEMGSGDQKFQKERYDKSRSGLAQVQYSFDPMAFSDEDEVIDKLGQKFMQDYPEVQGGKSFRDRVVLDMTEGRAVITFMPSQARPASDPASAAAA